MIFSERPASSQWETIPLADAPDHFIWVWYKPDHLPDGLVIRVPDEVFANFPHPNAITARRLFHAAGIDAATVATWTVHGTTYDAQFGSSPLLDYPLPIPTPDVDPNIAVRIHTVSPAMPAMNVNTGIPASLPAGDFAAAYDRIDADWQVIRQLEAQLGIVRKQVTTIHGRLSSLNRDLSPDERLHADRKDRSDWQIARRWLRDLTTRLSKVIKDQDIGETSNAGRRQQFEEIIEKHITPRVPMENVTQWQREFETYRKIVQSLLMNMNAALSQARQDGEQRADQILKRIAASVQRSRSRR